MINLDSELARAHPEWVFDAEHGPGLPSRHQRVLDLGHADAYELVLERISGLVDAVGIEFIKWGPQPLPHRRRASAVGSGACECRPSGPTG